MDGRWRMSRRMGQGCGIWFCFMIFGKNATSSSVYTADWLLADSSPPRRAVDGITDYVGSWQLYRFCTNDCGDDDQWIMVDLEESYHISGVNIVHYHSQPRLVSGDIAVLVTVNDEPALLSDEDTSKCVASSGIIESIWSYIQCDKVRTGRYVRAAPHYTLNDGETFCITEFEVVGFSLAP